MQLSVPLYEYPAKMVRPVHANVYCVEVLLIPITLFSLALSAKLTDMVGMSFIVADTQILDA